MINTYGVTSNGGKIFHDSVIEWRTKNSDQHIDPNYFSDASNVNQSKRMKMS